MSDARAVLNVSKKSRLRLNDQPVHASVSFRFFQKPSNQMQHYNQSQTIVHSHGNIGARNRGCSVPKVSIEAISTTGQPQAQTLYSPQDARSDFQNTKVEKVKTVVPISNGSPEARKSKVQKTAVSYAATTEHESTSTSEPQIGYTEKDMAGTVMQPPVTSNRVPAAKPSATTRTAEAKEPQKTFASRSNGPLTMRAILASDTLSSGDLQRTMDTEAQAPPTDLGKRNDSVADEASDKPKPNGSSNSNVLGTIRGKSEHSPESHANIIPLIQLPLDAEVVESVTNKTESPDDKVLSKHSPYPKIMSQVQRNFPPKEDAEQVTLFLSASEEVDRMDANMTTSNEPEIKASTNLPDATAIVEHLAPSSSTPEASHEGGDESTEPEKILTAEPQLSGTESLLPGASTSTGPTNQATLKSDKEAVSKKQFIAEAAKRSGPQQTASLNPFAKPKRAQRQKQKDIEKRDKRKKQEEQAAQAKVGRSNTSDSSNISISQLKDENQTLESSLPVANVSTDAANMIQFDTKKTETVTSKAKSRGKGKVADSEVSKGSSAADVFTSSPSEPVGGESNNATPERNGVVTKKAEESIKKEQVEGASFKSSPPHSPIQLPDKNGATPKVETSTSPNPSLASKANWKPPPKKGKILPAVPDINTMSTSSRSNAGLSSIPDASQNSLQGNFMSCLQFQNPLI